MWSKSRRTGQTTENQCYNECYVKINNVECLYHWFIHLYVDVLSGNGITVLNKLNRVGPYSYAKPSVQEGKTERIYNSTLNNVFAARSCVCHPYVRPSVCLSVCLSVTFRYVFHAGWNTSQMISWLISLRFLLGLTSTSAIWSKGNTPKFGWSRKPAIFPKRCKIGGGCYDGLTGSSIRAFDSY